MKRSFICAAGALVLFGTLACHHQPVTATAPAPGPGLGKMAPMQVDQVNTDGWDKGWTNLLNDTEQSFTPALPKLRAVEVELIVGNPGELEDELTLTVRNRQDEKLVAVTQIVKVNEADRVMFLMPNGGVPITPGGVYAIQLSGGPTFGWKYVVGGYDRGEATFNGKPLLADARSTFLFRTFGDQ